LGVRKLTDDIEWLIIKNNSADEHRL